MNKHHAADCEASACHQRSLRRTFLLALIPAVVLAGSVAQSAENSLAVTNDDSGNVEVTSLQETAAVALQDATATAAANPGDANPVAGIEVPPEIVNEPAGDFGIEIVPNRKFTVNGLTYRQVYDSIPFSRSEYLANPTYRQDATMELLTGVPRQTVINRTYEPRLNEPLAPQPEFLYNRYGTFGGTFGPQVGYGGGFGGGFYMPQYAPAFRYFLPLEYGF